MSLVTFAALLLQVQAPVGVLAPGETLLEVAAVGEVKAVPDVAEFSTGIVTDAPTAKAALAANSAAASRLVAAVASAGVAEKDARTSDLAVRPRYRPDKDGDDSDEIIGYRATNRLTVRVRDIAAAPALVDAMVAAGANDLSGPSFSFADEKPLIARARSAAVANAQQEANDYAAALAMRPGRILRVSERASRGTGGDDIIVTASRAAAAPIRPGEQTITVTVWVDYALVR